MSAAAHGALSVAAAELDAEISVVFFREKMIGRRRRWWKMMRRRRWRRAGEERREERERMEREWDPDADASETKEGRGERKYRFTARKTEGSIIQGAFTLRELLSEVKRGTRRSIAARLDLRTSVCFVFCVCVCVFFFYLCNRR